MNILVTGSSGFLGAKLVENLIKKKHFVTGVDILKKKINYKNYKHYILDISKSNNKKKLSKLVKGKDLIIHTAARQPHKIEFEINKYMSVNFIGTKNVLEAARNCKIKKFIYCSSFSVYENQKGTFKENDDLNPNNTYGLSKKITESLVKFYSINYNIKTIILRFDGIFGFQQNLPGFIKMCMSEVILRRNIVLFNKGKIKRDYLYIDDAVQSIILSIKKINNFQFEIFNIGGGNPTTLYNIFKKIKKICNSNSIVINKKTKKQAFKNIFMNINKAEKIINFKPNKLENNLKKLFYDFKK